MNISLVTYTKTFNLGNYSSERIGVEVEVGIGESAKEALDTAKQLVEEYHQQTTPDNSILISDIRNHIMTTQLPETQVQKKQPEVREQSLEEQIRSCTDLKVLSAYQLLVKKDPILQKAYDDTMSTIKFHKM